jgi:hypothetical protein
MERRVVMKRLAMRNDQLSLRLAPDDDAMEETATTYANGAWELHIINHLISCCDVGGLEQIDEETSTDTDSDFEEIELGYEEDEPAPVAKSNKEKRRRKQEERQDAGNVLLQCCNSMAG